MDEDKTAYYLFAHEIKHILGKELGKIPARYIKHLEESVEKLARVLRRLDTQGGIGLENHREIQKILKEIE